MKRLAFVGSLFSYPLTYPRLVVFPMLQFTGVVFNDFKRERFKV